MAYDNFHLRILQDYRTFIRKSSDSWVRMVVCWAPFTSLLVTLVHPTFGSFTRGETTPSGRDEGGEEGDKGWTSHYAPLNHDVASEASGENWTGWTHLAHT